MIGLLFIIFPVAEVIVFMRVGDTYGYFNAFMALIVSFIVGLMVVQSQGRAFLMRAQMELMRGELPANAVLQSALVFIGGLFLMIPGFISDVIGLLCIIPGPRHLIGVWARGAFKRQLAKGKIRFFGNGGGFNAGGFGAGFGSGQGGPFDPNEFFKQHQQNGANHFERDVSPKVIDVKAESVKDDDSNK